MTEREDEARALEAAMEAARRAASHRTPASDLDPYDEDSVVFAQLSPLGFVGGPDAGFPAAAPTGPSGLPIALGESLQLVRFSRRGDTLMITGLTPHGRRLTFEQRPEREGWYVVVAGRRRRPSARELALVVASINQEMEAAMTLDHDEDVRSALLLATSWDGPGARVHGLQAYRDLLLDEAAAFLAGQTERLAVVAIEYQAFKRFAIRHGHRVGQGFVRALGERLVLLFGGQKKLHVCHKAGKSFRLIAVDRSSDEIQAMIAELAAEASRRWIVEHAWGGAPQTHPDEVHFYVGFAMTRAADRGSSYETLAQRLSDDAFRAAKLGQLSGHTSIQAAKADYRTTVRQWVRTSEDDLQELAGQLDDGPAELLAEMTDYLHELVPANLDGMAVAGDVGALVHKAIARDGFWQGTTPMRLAGERLVRAFLGERPLPEGSNPHVGGFALGDEFYGIAIEGDRLFFAWGDLNSAGATRVRAGLDRIQHAVGWRRTDGGGIAGRFLRAVRGEGEARPLPERVREACDLAHAELAADPALHVNDAVDIAGHLWTLAGEPCRDEDLFEGATLRLALTHGSRRVRVLERRGDLALRLDVDGVEHVASIAASFTGPSIKLRLRGAVISAALCILDVGREDLLRLVDTAREDAALADDAPIDIVGFLRHVADILLADQVKGPGKIELALGRRYQAADFVLTATLDDVRARHPGLFYESLHQHLLDPHPLEVDRNLQELIVGTMLARTRPD